MFERILPSLSIWLPRWVLVSTSVLYVLRLQPRLFIIFSIKSLWFINVVQTLRICYSDFMEELLVEATYSSFYNPAPSPFLLLSNYHCPRALCVCHTSLTLMQPEPIIPKHQTMSPGTSYFLYII